ncbi:MAG: indolepyruvate ferredoxin oxidoreductase [Ilumatobacteraceae bacterium]
MALTESNTDEFSLQQRYEAAPKQILATGIQALVRLPIDLMRADRAKGWNTAAFISGYQGSPLGGYDRELQSQRKLLDELNIVHVPGLNEELAATSVFGSQVAQTYARPKYEGVAGVWYGKSPGLDRAGDAIRHGSFGGTGRKGGVVLLVGDDAAAKSSTLPSRSDPTLVALHLPVFYPGTVQEVLDLGLHAFAMSRLTGLWVAMKITTPVADGSGIAEVSPSRIDPVLPDFEVDGKPWVPTLSGHVGVPFANTLEIEVLGNRIEWAKKYVAANPLNQFVSNPADAWLGIVAGGHDMQQVLEALRVLGLTPERLCDLGIRVLKLGALHPLDHGAIRALANGTATIMVCEDKIDFLESRVRSILYGTANAPAVIGKVDHDGKPLITHYGALTINNLVDSLQRVLTLRIPADQLSPVRKPEPVRISLGAEAVRTPFFCSGCPHNTGLLVPEGSLVGAGIGCHGMVSIVPREQTGHVMGITQMGGEGAQWIGTAPFVEDEHFFQNMGDGTYFHSGQLAVQAAIASGTTMTFKILYNAAVAMTGGQDAAGLRSVPEMTQMLMAEGVKHITITTDDPAKYRGVDLPSGVDVVHRDAIVEAQEKLRVIDGVTVHIHDQQCAAEKRRDRKRGILAPATFRVMIDERVCEACGDCGVKSNCLSLHSTETEFGRKTVVDQASCNVDASCLKGDCPAFITVKLGTAKKAKRASPDGGTLPEPKLVVPKDVAIRMPGIGGTGVVTVSQVLAAAAQIAGVDARTADQTGLSQKAGPVVSTVTLGDPTPGQIGVLLAFDALASSTPANLAGLDQEHSVAVVSTSIAPTGRMIGKVASHGLDLEPLRAELSRRSDATRNLYVDAAHIVTALLGNAVTANVFMVGVAYQAGFIPLPGEAIERAIELNGTAVELNLAAFRWGRRWTVDPGAVDKAAGASIAYELEPYSVEGIDDEVLRELVERRAGDLVAYQNRAYAARYVKVVVDAHHAEQKAGGDGSFAAVVARQLHHVMAYKDEYEVARLLLAGRGKVAAQFGHDAKMTWNLYPPMLRSMGLGHKLRFGAWSTPVLAMLRRMKGLRGTALDPFGHSKVRRTERAMVKEYTKLVDEASAMLATDPAKALELVGLIDQVRGYEGVKMANVERYREALATARQVLVH